MKSSRTFRILIRLIGVAGICVGLFMLFVALAFLISKTPGVHLASLIIGLVITTGSLYLICGAPHLVRFIERRHRYD
jgi:hypothetical protein